MEGNFYGKIHSSFAFANPVDFSCRMYYSNSNSYNCNTTGQTTEIADCDNEKHHKKWDKLDENLPSSSTCVYVFFSGHMGCGVTTDPNTQELVHGWGGVPGYDTNNFSIAIVGGAPVSNVGDDGARLLLHEISHVLNAKHDLAQYDDEESADYDPSKIYRMNCTMGYYRKKPPASTNLIICSYCQSEIDKYKHNFYNH